MTHLQVSWLIHECHDSFTSAMTHSRVPWLIHECHDSFTSAMTHSRVSWLIVVTRVRVFHMQNALSRSTVNCLFLSGERESPLLHSPVWHDSAIGVTRLHRVCHLTRSSVLHNSLPAQPRSADCPRPPKSILVVEFRLIFELFDLKFKKVFDPSLNGCQHWMLNWTPWLIFQDFDTSLNSSSRRISTHLWMGSNSEC